MSAPITAVAAYQWACPLCHDTGLATEAADAAAALDEHDEDYH